MRARARHRAPADRRRPRRAPRPSSLGIVALVALSAVLRPAVGHAELVAPVVSPVRPIPAAELVPPGIDATNFVLLDAASGQVLLARAPEERRPVASTIKVLTAMTAAERLSADATVTVGDEVLDVGGSEVGLRPGDRWGLEDLLEALLVRSGNEVAEALAVATSGGRDPFVEQMRADAEALGLDGAVITEPSGLADGNLLSALDLATVGRTALQHPIVAPIVARPSVVLPGVGEVENRNLLVGTYPGATGIKTGFTTAAGNVIIASARRDGRELVVVLLGSGPDPARFRDAERLLDVGFDAFEEVDATLGYELAAGAGWWTTEAPEVPGLLVPVGRDVHFEVDAPALLGGPLPDARLVVGDHEALRLRVVARPPEGGSGPRPGASSAARLAEGVADGVYAGLRAAVGAGRLG